MPEFIITYSPLLIGILFALVFGLAAYAVYTELRLRRFLRGQNGASLEGVIAHMTKEHAHMLEADTSIAKTSKELRTLLGNTVRGVSVVRFNALSGDSSGKQSFALALLSEKGNGVVISSLHARDNARVYAKPIQKFTSEYELTDEEKKAILQAQKNL